MIKCAHFKVTEIKNKTSKTRKIITTEYEAFLIFKHIIFKNIKILSANIHSNILYITHT